MKINYKVEGIDCPDCGAEFEEAISDVKGVTNATFNFMTTRLVVEYDEAVKDTINKTLTDFIKDYDSSLKVKRI